MIWRYTIKIERPLLAENDMAQVIASGLCGPFSTAPPV